MPAPNTNYKLFVEYEHNGIQKKDVFTEIITHHQHNRLKGYEPLLIAFVNSIHYFEKSTELQSPLNGPIKNDLNFTIIEHSTKNYLQHTQKIKIQHLKLILQVEDIHTKKQRAYFN